MFIWLLQALGRIYRVGTKSNPVCRIVFARTFGDEPHILAKLVQKSAVLEEITGTDDIVLLLEKYQKWEEGRKDQIYLD
jgi:hypothetical protein